MFIDEKDLPSQELIEAVRWKAAFMNYDTSIDYYIKNPVRELMRCKHFVPRWSCHGHYNEIAINYNKRKFYKRNNDVSYVIFVANSKGVEILYNLFKMFNNGNPVMACFELSYLNNDEIKRGL